MPSDIIEYCKNSDKNYYIMSQGYRKVPGDVCVGGTVHNPLQIDCPGKSAWTKVGSSVIFLLVIIVILYFAVNYFDKIEGYYYRIVLGKSHSRAGISRAMYSRDFNRQPNTAEMSMQSTTEGKLEPEEDESEETEVRKREGVQSAA